MPQLYNITSDDIFLKYSLKMMTQYRRLTFSRTVTVSVGISAMGRTDLHFVDPGVKINCKYYRDLLLTQNLLPDIRQQSDYFIFQQDGVPAHRAKETVELLKTVHNLMT